MVPIEVVMTRAVLKIIMAREDGLIQYIKPYSNFINAATANNTSNVRLSEYRAIHHDPFQLEFETEEDMMWFLLRWS